MNKHERLQGKLMALVGAAAEYGVECEINPCGPRVDKLDAEVDGLLAEILDEYQPPSVLERIRRFFGLGSSIDEMDDGQGFSCDDSAELCRLLDAYYKAEKIDGPECHAIFDFVEARCGQ